MNRTLLAALALACVCFPALADVAATAATQPPSVVLPYGQWIVDYGPTVASWGAVALSGVASVAIAKYAPWAASVMTQRRVQMAAEALAQYAINAVPNSVKEGKVTVNAGPAVVAAAVQRGVDVLPGRVLKAAQAGGGLSAIVFRVLNLEEGASKANVLDPAVASVKAAAAANNNAKLAKAA